MDVLSDLKHSRPNSLYCLPLLATAHSAIHPQSPSTASKAAWSPFRTDTDSVQERLQVKLPAVAVLPTLS
jgi:hypothetical protein